MVIVLLIFALAAGVWGALFATRGSLWAGCAAFIGLGYVLGPPLWSPHLGPIALTADRLLLLGLGATAAWQARTGQLSLRRMTEFDWLVLALVGYLTIRCALTPAPPAGGSHAGAWWRLIAAFWVPSCLYAVARLAPQSARTWRVTMASLAALGAFLSFTAYAEIGHQWWAVFPHYISDPTLGTHFGRARGPALNSASLGVMLTVCFWAAWLLWPQVKTRWRAVLTAVVLAITGAVYFTYTRSTWMGLFAGLAVVPLLQLPRQWRLALALVVLFAGTVGILAFGEKLTNLSRKDSDDSSEHSVYQRESFAYVSARMFRDAPIFGCGFGRFYDLKMPYLSDRSQKVELESLRTLDHHNTFLSILVETGLVGFALFVGVLAGWTKIALRLIRDPALPAWQQAHGLFLLAVLVNYAMSAMFHDLTLLPTEHWALFLAAGAGTGLLADQRVAAGSHAVAPLASPAPSLTPHIHRLAT